MITKPQIIENENIACLVFYKRKPEQNISDSLKNKILQALLLGNIYKRSCHIIFEDVEGMKIVETKIWYYSDTHIGLFGSITIPLYSIKDIMF